MKIENSNKNQVADASVMPLVCAVSRCVAGAHCCVIVCRGTHARQLSDAALFVHPEKEHRTGEVSKQAFMDTERKAGIATLHCIVCITG